MRNFKIRGTVKLFGICQLTARIRQKTVRSGKHVGRQDEIVVEGHSSHVRFELQQQQQQQTQARMATASR